MSNTLRNVLKISSYVLVPILILIIVWCAFAMYFNKDGELKNTNDFFESEQCAELYLTSILNNTSLFTNTVYRGYDYEENVYRNYYNQDIYLKEELVTIEEKIGTGAIENSANGYYYNNYYGEMSEIQRNVKIGKGTGDIVYIPHLNKKNFTFLVIDYNKGVAYTNVTHIVGTDTIEGIKDYISRNTSQTYWNFENNQINTSISTLSMEKIKYNNNYIGLENDYNVDICTGLIQDLPYQDQYQLAKVAYDLAKTIYDVMPLSFILPVCSVLMIGCFVFIGITAGKKDENGNIILNWFDKTPLGVAGILDCAILFLGIICFASFEANNFEVVATFISIGIVLVYISIIIFCDTFIKRVKSKTLLKNTLTYKLFKWIGKGISNLTKNMNVTLKLAVSIIVLGIISLILVYNRTVFSAIVLCIIWFIVFIYLQRKSVEAIEIKNALKQMYEGSSGKVHLDEKKYKGIAKEAAVYVNDIAGGFSNAMQESLKSERLKTELITNVSHDIKTPLTSIINYVDLLKKEQVPNKKVEEYLEILDGKSQRLKRLTEDLLEASKASSGNLKLNMEKLNVKQLINQVSGEFLDKFEDKKLEEIISTPDEDIYISADSRYLFRVLENMYSNIAKYALENSRVYIDVIKNNKKVTIQIKNISRDKLNISSDELMQRFVRGEKSRNTEGSGLGLSIAQSLTQLQKGKFNIYLDGDLFKVIIEFDIIEETETEVEPEVKKVETEKQELKKQEKGKNKKNK